MSKAFDFSTPPFDRLTGRELERFKASLDVAFFRKGDTVIRAGEVPESFFIVVKGAIQEVHAGEVVAVHGPNDCFDTSLLVERQSRHAFIVEEEAICYLLPVDELIDLTANNKAFAEFFFRDISLKLDALAARQTIRELQPVMMAQVRDAYIHPPLYVDTSTSAYDAARLMSEQKATSLLVRDRDRVGIVTGFDLRELVILQRRPLETPVGEAARYDLDQRPGGRSAGRGAAAHDQARHPPAGGVRPGPDRRGAGADRPPELPVQPVAHRRGADRARELDRGPAPGERPADQAGAGAARPRHQDPLHHAAGGRAEPPDRRQAVRHGGAARTGRQFLPGRHGQRGPRRPDPAHRSGQRPDPARRLRMRGAGPDRAAIHRWH